MKTVFTNRQTIAHYWANQIQDSARYTGGNFYYNGKIIYSYGGHFPIANIVDSKHILFTTRKYSNTTAKHIQSARQAIDRDKYTIIYCYDPAPYLGEKTSLLQWLVKEANNLIEDAKYIQSKLLKARKPENYIYELQGILNTFLNIEKFADSHIKTLPQENKDWLKNARKRARQVKKELQNICIVNDIKALKDTLNTIEQARKKAEQEKIKKAIADFKEGKPQIYIAGEISYLRVFSRPVEINATEQDCINALCVQTSRGIILDYNEARQLYAAFKAGRLLGAEVQNYKITSVQNNMVKAGCHLIPFTEIEYAAKELNLCG